MIFDRRSVLKALALAPAAFLRRSPLLQALVPPDDKTADNLVHIYLVGLFLMEFQQSQYSQQQDQPTDLVLVTPNFHHHKFFTVDLKTWKHGDLPEYINLWDRLKPGSAYEFCEENLRFPANVVSNGYLLHPESPGKHDHKCTIVLPKPSAITVCHSQPLHCFDPKQSSKVGLAIQKAAADANVKCLGSVTHLHYQPQDGVDPFKIAYVALHRPMTPGTVNGALRACKHACGQGFDLQMQTLPASGSDKCPSGDCLAGC
ncbi:MAG TPA: hypothetical protein VHQ22_16185 [Terriglobales bacterium]|jgi:hypothetical protein|nr:hypothetical protein [Terriglobales bacterium]